MKADPYMSYIHGCPATGKAVSTHDFAYSRGVCHVCGDVQEGTFTHAEIIPGRWVRPSLWEWIWGERKVFVRKP